MNQANFSLIVLVEINYLSITKGRSRFRCVSKRSIKAGRELDSITEHRDSTSETILRKNLLDGPHPPIHHVGRSHDVGSCFGECKSLRSEEWKSRRVIDTSICKFQVCKKNNEWLLQLLNIIYFLHAKWFRDNKFSYFLYLTHSKFTCSESVMKTDFSQYQNYRLGPWVSHPVLTINKLLCRNGILGS